MRFAHCQQETDVMRFKSDAYDSIGFDELTEFTLFIWTYVSTRNRLSWGWPGRRHPPARQGR